MKERLIVVGNGMAGVRAIEELLARAPDRYAITVFGSEPHPTYNRIMLSPVLAGEKSFEDIVTHDRAWYAGTGIALHTGARLSDSIRRKNGSTRRTAGASPTTSSCSPPAPTHSSSRSPARISPGSSPSGHGRRRCHAGRLRDGEARRSRRRRAPGARGGERPYVPRDDGDGRASHADRDGATARPNRLVTSSSASWRAAASPCSRRRTRKRSSATARSRRCASRTDRDSGRHRGHGRGYRPNADLARAAGLAVERGVIVDDRMVTSDPDILAVGECVQHRGQTYGLVRHSTKWRRSPPTRSRRKASSPPSQARS